MKYQAPRGTRDLAPPRSLLFRRIQQLVDEVFSLYGCLPLETPIFESTDLFSRSIGEETDIVSKEMYTFPDRKGRSLTLRPEGTASAVRAYLEQGLHEKGLDRFHYFGPMFRYERPQAGRFRQFYQLGVEVFADPGPEVDAEVIESFHRFCRLLGLEGLEVRLNSVGCPECRPRYVEAIREQLRAVEQELCPQCQRRLERNALRVLDCKVEACRARFRDLPVITSYLCGPCSGHFQGVQEGLNALAVPYVLAPWLVRGLDYYTRTAFEVVSGHLGAQDAVGGGGRYDLLVEQFGGPPTPAVGFASGVDRLLMVLEQTHPAEAAPGAGRQVYLATLGPPAARAGLELARRLRDGGVAVVTDTGAGGLGKKLKRASKLGCGTSILLGDSELDAGEAVVKDMVSGEQRRIALEAIVDFLTKSGPDDLPRGREGKEVAGE